MKLLFLGEHRDETPSWALLSLAPTMSRRLYE